MRRLRTSYLDDWEDMGVTDRPRLRFLGLSVHPIVALVAMIGLSLLVLVVAYASQLDWFPKTPVARWGVLSFAVVGLLVAVVVSIISARVMVKSLHRSRMHLARLDGATDEEARRDSDRFIRNNLYIKLGVYAAGALALWVILGSPWVFEWGGPLPYLYGIIVFMAVFITYASGLGERIWNWLRRAAAGRGR